MITQCESCIHKKVCSNIHIVEQITNLIEMSTDHIEVMLGDKACKVKDIPWLNLNQTAISCANYQQSVAYRNAMQMVQTCKDAVNRMF